MLQCVAVCCSVLQCVTVRINDIWVRGAWVLRRVGPHNNNVRST